MDWLEGRLDDSRAEEVARAVATGDEQLTRTVAWAKGFLDVAAAHPLERPPPVVRQSLGQHFRRWAESSEAPGVDGTTALAELIFDSRAGLARAGVRSASASDTVHLAFASDLGDLVLDVLPGEPGLVRLDGQILVTSPDAPFFAVEVVASALSFRSVDVDQHGRFELDRVPAGPVRLTASNGQVRLVADVDLGADGSS